jgi:hypothetical protein
VLATTVFGRRAGFDVAAILWPRPGEEHAERTLRAAIAEGLEAYPATALTVPEVLIRRRRKDDFVIFAGGLSLSAALTYVDAVEELVHQVREGALPDPDTIVVALGTGTTLAGLLAGVALHGLKARLVGVEVAWNPLSRAGVLALAHAAVRARRGSLGPLHLGRRLVIDGAHVGSGYGQATALARRAAVVGLGVGLGLDPTYTAKAFSRALEEVHHPEFVGQSARRAATANETRPSPTPLVARPRQTLYWHTLSAVSLEPLLERAMPLDPALQKLLIRTGAPQ